jgi:hypothetical protein
MKSSRLFGLTELGAGAVNPDHALRFGGPGQMRGSSPRMTI